MYWRLIVSLNVKDKILQASNENCKYCLLKVDYNQFERYKYFARDKEYLSYEIIDFSVKKKSNTGLAIKVNKDELLDICSLFINKFISGENVWFKCIRKHEYNRTKMSPYRNCDKVDMSLMNFSKRMNDVMDCSQTQHFQFSLSSKKHELCGFVHGFEALSELTKNMALNLDNSKVRLKIKL